MNSICGSTGEEEVASWRVGFLQHLQTTKRHRRFNAMSEADPPAVAMAVEKKEPLGLERAFSSEALVMGQKLPRKGSFVFLSVFYSVLNGVCCQRERLLSIFEQRSFVDRTGPEGSNFISFGRSRAVRRERIWEGLDVKNATC